MVKIFLSEFSCMREGAKIRGLIILCLWQYRAQSWNIFTIVTKMTTWVWSNINKKLLTVMALFLALII